MSDIEKRRNVYYSNFTFKGERIRRTLGTSDPEEARKNCDKLRAALWEEIKKPQSQRYTFTDAFAEWLETGEKSLSDRYSINAFGLADKPLSEITEPVLAEILRRNKGATRNRKINLLHAILNCAVRKGWIEAVPYMAKVEVGESRIRWMTQEEWQALLSQLSGNLRQMARFAIATGLREANVLGLQWNQIDMQRRVAWIHPDQSKSGRSIGIPLSDDAVTVLREQIGKHDTFVFVRTYKKHGEMVTEPVTRASGDAWKAALVRAGIDVVERNKKKTSTFRWHDLRHTWASWHIMAGTPLEVLQKLGGWETLSMVLRYAHLAPEHLATYANNAIQKPSAKACGENV